ncbi:MAG TPA: tyrosine-type recombinase/integrase, partial [Terriglobales bacterium]
PAKTGEHAPKKIPYRLHPEVGRLLEMQRQAVVEKCGHLAPLEVAGPDYGQLALLPATRLTADRSAWTNVYANQNAGMLSDGGFGQTYIKPIKDLTKVPIAFTALRHTIGTQLAQMGCSAHTIQAVLKHASDATCRAYVDIAFEGLIDELSEGLKPSFEKHFPVINTFVSVSDPIALDRRIESEDVETGRFENTGMCGRHVACSYAPITCYACPRFIPCHDADHSINLDVVDREIAASEGRGLAMQHDVQRWKTVRNHIRLVMTACDQRHRALELEANAGAEKAA